MFGVSCLFFLKIFAQDSNLDNKDFYTAIAAQGQQSLEGRPLETIPPVVLPDSLQLPWAGNTQYKFKPLPKITTQQEIQEAIEKLKNQYAPFMRNLAPSFSPVRKSIRIESMQFRYETDRDCQDFKRLVQGEGEWENITMPYYHGMQGVSTAWYRKEVYIADSILNKPSVFLHFNGSDYYTDAFVNGHHVGFHEGMLDEFEFNIKKYLHVGNNTLLIKVRNDYSMLGGEGNPRRWGNKLSASNCPGWDDPFSGWSCWPTGFGIYQDLYIEGRSMPYLTDIYCRPLLAEKAVELWTEVDLENGDKADDFILEYSLFGQNFKAEIIHQQRKQIRVEGGRVLNKTKIKIPDTYLRLWEPSQPWLYQIQVSLYDKSGTKCLDNRKQQFGMRHFVLSSTSTPKGRMYLNGKEVRLRGANTMGFLQKDVMKHDWNQLQEDLLLAKLTNMNFIRTTQRIVQKEVYEYADKLGMMMQADLPLFAYINQKQYTEILKQAGNIERVLRNHPSVILMSYLNEPMAEMKAHAISRYAYERLFDALDIVVRNENPERAVKYIDGDYQAPNNGYPDNHCYNIWYDEHGISLSEMCRGAWMPISKGWMYGCGEFGAEGLDPVDLMNRRYPKEWLQTENDGSWSPKYMHGIYQGEQTYGKHWNWFETQSDMEGWVRESHKHQAWGIQKVARAFRRMPRMNSFAVHLFIDAWPNGWMKALIDCERRAKPAWYLYRDALTPLSVQVENERTDFFSEDVYNFPVWICNDTQRDSEIELWYVMEVNGKIVNSGCSPANMPSVTEGSSFQGFIPVRMPKVNSLTQVRVRVSLIDKKEQTVIHEDIASCRVYPAYQIGKKKTVCLLGTSEDANSIVQCMGLNRLVDISSNPDLILVSDSLLSVEYYSLLEKNAQLGSLVLFLPSSLNESLSQKLGLQTGFKKNDSWIVFRNEKHPWLEGSSSTDLKYNYSIKQQAPERHFFHYFQSEVYTPVLTHSKKLVLAERKMNKGTFVVCGLKLEGKLETTPILNKMLYLMMEGK